MAILNEWLNEDEGEILQWPDRVTGEGTARVTIKIAPGAGLYQGIDRSLNEKKGIN
jgi:hypothetical protein